jgi:hypothetical protein
MWTWWRRGTQESRKNQHTSHTIYSPPYVFGSEWWIMYFTTYVVIIALFALSPTHSYTTVTYNKAVTTKRHLSHSGGINSTTHRFVSLQTRKDWPRLTNLTQLNCGKHWSQHGPASLCPCPDDLRLWRQRVQLNIRQLIRYAHLVPGWIPLYLQNGRPEFFGTWLLQVRNVPQGC